MKILLTIELADRAKAREVRMYLERYLTTYVPEATCRVEVVPEDQGELFVR